VPAAKQLFDRASDILGYDLLQVCIEGAPTFLITNSLSTVVLLPDVDAAGQHVWLRQVTAWCVQAQRTSWTPQQSASQRSMWPALQQWRNCVPQRARSAISCTK
jgi:hypothetical protein